MTIGAAAAGASQAATLVSDFTVDGASGGLGVASPYGEVTVNDAGGTLAFTVNLFDGLVFRNSPDTNHWSFTFDLNVATATIGSVADNGAGTFHAVAGPVAQKPFGSFEYVLDCNSGCSTGYNAASPTQLTFVVSAPTTLTTGSIVPNSDGYLFAADVANTGGATGNVASTGLKASVPEPASWAMMLVGFGGLG